MQKLYFGTPYRHYRAKVLQHLGEVPLKFLYPHAKKSGTVLDIQSGELSSGEPLKYHQVPHRLLKILTSDLYRQHRLASVHAALFPKRFYNPDSSPDLIHQALRRLRVWLKEQSLSGFKITEKNSSYFFQIEGNLSLQYRAETPPKLEHQLFLLKQKFGQTPFSSPQAAAAMECSKRTAISFLGEAHRQSLLSRTGQGKQTRYRIR